jgi:ketosteroid isomerase-like protein
MTGLTGSTRRQTAQRFVMQIGRRDIDQAIELLSPGVRYHVLGNHALAGTFSGPEEVRKHLISLDDRTLGTFEAIKWEDWLVGEDHVAALATIRMSAGGKLFTGRHLFLAEFDVADMIVGITIFFEDEASALRFFGPPALPEDHQP